MSGSVADPGSPLGVFCTIFAFTAFPFGLAMGLIRNDLQGGLIMGFAFGLLFALAMTPLMRVVRVTREYSDRSRFERKLKLEMDALRYSSIGVDLDLLQFRAPNTIAVSMNRISVHLDDAAHAATFAGPRMMVRKVTSRI